ncbi:MAG: S41 family peptidase [Verrucomicrobiota bacterium]
MSSQALSAESDLPPLSEVLGIVRSNLPGIDEAELNQAAVEGLISKLQPRVALVTGNTNPPMESNGDAALVRRSAIYEEAFGFVRIGRVAAGLAEAFDEALSKLETTNKLKGLVLDLRFAGGDDYRAAAAVADRFMDAEKALVKWSDSTLRSKSKTNAIAMPVVLLVNQETAGAAEVLAGILRECDSGILIGTQTAGQAHLFREFPLSTGQRLRIATDAVEVGDQHALPVQGLAPDIAIAVSKEDEKAFFEDPFKVLPKLFAEAAKAGSNTVAGATNRPPRRRLNEADLVRMQREGVDLDLEINRAQELLEKKAVITDPALSRGIDLLKGLAVVQSRL